ncbi:hypothetical protein HPB51_004213 [Rhipicephalus microplus]|uniref:C2H2-type domain-containing protein n=1 Tax=Rhipicephalus microplus TaxID=6941 RepID=A0A9J6DYR6_RHIMP|nr:hypothetical protein HPB51_004213 [Rhipicephalus microplus]
MPTPRRPPAVFIKPLVPGSGSHRRRPAPPSGLSTPVPLPAQRPRPATPASTGVSAAASGPPRSRPLIVHQGIMTVYLPVPGILRCPYPCCTGCQARTSVSLRLSAWRSHMEQKHGIRPTRRLYRCVACDARFDSLSARHDCPGPASNEPFHPCRYCPKYFNCERSLARHTMAWHAQEQSTPYVPLRNPRQPTATPCSSSSRETPPSPSPAPSGTACRAPPVLQTRVTVSRSRRRRGGQSSTSTPSSSTGSDSSTSATGSPSASSSEASTMPGHSSATSGSGSSTPRQSPSVPGTPPSVPPDPGPPSTTGEVSSMPGSSSRRHTGPGSTSSASGASSRMSTELADVPGTDDSDDASANEPVDEQSVPAAGTVVDRHTLSANSRSSSSPSLSEQLKDTGTDDADDGAHDTPVEAPAMEMPPDCTMLLAEQVRVLRASLRSAPTPDSWATCEQA